jgi:ribonuclease-3
MEIIEAVENKIGITFNNKYLLLQAMTHRSHNNNPDFVFEDEDFVYNYERIEFLGDSILKFVVGAYLYENFPQSSEGAMTVARHATVDNDVSLVTATEALDIFHYVKQCLEPDSHSLRKGSPPYRKFAADIFEALIGAIYLDQGGFFPVTFPREYDVYGAFIHK